MAAINPPGTSVAMRKGVPMALQNMRPSCISAQKEKGQSSDCPLRSQLRDA
jgi:hypothetical protein